MESPAVKIPFLPAKINVTIEYAQSLIEKTSQERANVTESRSIDKFWSIAQSFVTSLQILWEYTHEIGSVAERTSLANLAHLPSLLKEIEERNSKKQKNEKPVATVSFSFNDAKENKLQEKSFPIFELIHVNKLQDCLTRHNRALRLLNETVLQQMVNAWERVLGELVGWKLNADSDIISNDKSKDKSKNRSISYSQLLSFSSFDEVRRHIISSEVIDFLKDKTSLEQIKYFKDELKVDFGSHFHYIGDLCEIVLRRHAIVHAGGRATSEYCRRLKQLKDYSGKIPKEGTDLLPESDYIKRAWSVVYAAGVVMTHLVAMNHARQKKNKDDEDIANSILINASFNSIKSEQYDAAAIILEYAHKLHLSDSSSDLMVAINLAQTYKWKGDDSKCQKILNEDKYNWKSNSANFRLCVAALRDDHIAFQKELSIVAQEGSLSAQELFEWPVFKSLVKLPHFTDWVKTAYGEKAGATTSAHKPKLIDFQPDKTISDIIKSMVNNMIQKPIPVIESNNFGASQNTRRSKKIANAEAILTSLSPKSRTKKKTTARE